MSHLLTIAIPTFNRATELDNQLNWVANAIKGLEAECEILICDNCSSDRTSIIIDKWLSYFHTHNIETRAVRHSENIGLMNNLLYCIQYATGEYVWVVGDDDDIKPQAIQYVVDNLYQCRDLRLLNLNLSMIDLPTGKILKSKFFDVAEEEFHPDGKAVIEKYLLLDKYSGFAFMTSQIYHRKSAQFAICKWGQEIGDNLEGQLLISAYCATQGNVKISSQVWANYNCGTNDLMKPEVWFRARYADLPKAYKLLVEIGYTRALYNQLIMNHFTPFRSMRELLGAIRRWPIFGFKTLISYTKIVITTFWNAKISVNS